MAGEKTSFRLTRSDPARWFTRAAIQRITWISVGLAVALIVFAATVGFLAFGHFSRSIESATEERLEAQASLAARKLAYADLVRLLDRSLPSTDGLVVYAHQQVVKDVMASNVRRIAIIDSTGRVAIDSADISNRGRVDHRFRADITDIERALDSDEPRTSPMYDLPRPDGTTKVAKTAYAPVPVPAVPTARPGVPPDAKPLEFVAAVELPLDYAAKISALKTIIVATVGAFSGFVVLVLAVASFRRMHKHLQAQAQKAQLSELSAAIAHEIKNPLAAMLTGLQLLKRGGSPQMQDTLRSKLEREVKLIDRIVRDFLAYARGVQRAPEPCTLGEVIAKARQQLTEEQEAILTVDADASLELVSDATALGQSIGNLCKNACDAAIAKHKANSVVDASASEASGRHRPEAASQEAARVVLSAAVKGNTLVMEVRDNGGGIPESLREDLFQPFVSGGTGGSGLGLAISRRLLSDLGSSVSLASTGPGGTTFRVTVPLGRGRGKRGGAATTTSRDHAAPANPAPVAAASVSDGVNA